VQGIPGCMMRITGGARCVEPTALRPVSLSQKHALQAKKGDEPAVKPPPPDGLPLKQSDNNHTAPRTAARVKDVTSVKDAGALAATNPIEAAREPACSLFDALPPPHETPNDRPKTDIRTPTQMQVFPEASGDDWHTLSCSESGQSLIKQADALLSRRAALQTALSEMRLRSDTVDKLEEATAAEKEVQAIDRELGKFRERAKAIINKPASN